MLVRPRLDRTFLLALAVPLALAVLAACGAGSQAPAGTPPAAPRAAPVGVDPAGAPDRSTAPPVALSEADCRAFGAARALGVAIVTSARPDCSGVGHDRIVLEVRRLARGERIATIVTSRPLVGPARDELAVGDALVVAIEPEVRAAETVYCVALPAREGVLRHAVAAGSLAAAERVLDELAAGRACPPGR